jgi:hypothetical protein
MLNPSTANEYQDDPTIRKCISYAKQWGYGGLYVLNLFPFKSTNPKQLLNIEDVYGGIDYQLYYNIFEECEKIICAWGNESIIKSLNPNMNIFNTFKHKLYCLELSKNGVPKHPLYLKQNISPKPFTL